MIEKLNGAEVIVLALVCGCILAAGLNSLRISNDVAQIEANVDAMAQMMHYCMTNHTAKAVR